MLLAAGWPATGWHVTQCRQSRIYSLLTQAADETRLFERGDQVDLLGVHELQVVVVRTLKQKYSTSNNDELIQDKSDPVGKKACLSELKQIHTSNKYLLFASDLKLYWDGEFWDKSN